MRASDKQLDEWLAAVAPRAIAYARSLLGKHADADAEDLVHDVLCRMLRHAEYDLPHDGEKLLFKSITNAAIDARSRRRYIASLDAEQHEGFSLASTLPDPAADSPADALAGAELSEAVEKALQALPQLQRAAIELKSLDKPLVEIAQILEITPTHAGVMIHRGRKTLEKFLAPFLRQRDR